MLSTLNSTRARQETTLAICLALSIGLFAAPAVHPLPQPRNQHEADSASPTFTVADLQLVLATEKGKSDGAIARKLSRLSLTERMSDATFTALQKGLPGPKSRSALRVMADVSVFLPPAPADVLPQAAPTLAVQRQMIAQTVDYVNQTIPRLPNLYANETIFQYRSESKQKRTSSPPLWRQIDTTNAIVSYRDGKEVVDYLGWINMPLSQKRRGLRVTGVFGPILSTVITDAAQGYMNWDHWEHGEKGPIAVFHYQITREQSQYAIGYYIAPGGDGISKQLTAYHGQISIDSATGAILRITVLADPPFGSPVIESDIMVQYGPVEIGGKPYICPLRSISLSLDAPNLPGGAMVVIPNGQMLQRMAGARWLNDTSFANYHLFRAEMQVITGESPAPPR